MGDIFYDLFVLGSYARNFHEIFVIYLDLSLASIYIALRIGTNYAAAEN